MNAIFIDRRRRVLPISTARLQALINSVLLGTSSTGVWEIRLTAAECMVLNPRTGQYAPPSIVSIRRVS